MKVVASTTIVCTSMSIKVIYFFSFVLDLVEDWIYPYICICVCVIKYINVSKYVFSISGKGKTKSFKKTGDG